MNKFDSEYHKVIESVLLGVDKMDRTGTGTRSIFGHMVRFDMSGGDFPLITTKSVWFKGVLHELLWFLDGGRNIKPLIENGVHIWTEWPYKDYLKVVKALDEPDMRLLIDDPKEKKLRPLTMEEFEAEILRCSWFANTYGDLGPVYGAQWRDWVNSIGEAVDQIKNVVNDLKTNPNSRRIMVSAWNPGEIDKMKLPPCHYAHQLYCEPLTHQDRYRYAVEHELLYSDTCPDCEIPDGVPYYRLSLMWNQRSCDIGLGIPFNIASYGILLNLYAQQANMLVGELIGSLGDVHIYHNHFDQIKEQLTRDPNKYSPPSIWLNPNVESIFDYKYDDIKILDYKSYPPIKMPIAI